MSGAEIAAEVAAALAEAGEATGDGPLVCALGKKSQFQPDDPWDGPPNDWPDLFDVTAVQDYQQIRDQSGTLTGESRRKLIVEATGAKPEKRDKIAVGVAKADVTLDTVFDTIVDVMPVSPGGVVLMYELELAL